MDKIKVVELFAGVGGFKLGLEGYNGKSSTSGYKDDINSPYKVIWSNQWEPSTKTQHASMVYKNRFSEGSMTFPDKLENPSRTIITGEGGNAPSRFKHVIKTEKGYRRLTSIELERLTMFPDNHTKLKGISDTKRAFFVGNALVVGIVEKIGIFLYKIIKNG